LSLPHALHHLKKNIRISLDICGFRLSSIIINKRHFELKLVIQSELQNKKENYNSITMDNNQQENHQQQNHPQQNQQLEQQQQPNNGETRKSRQRKLDKLETIRIARQLLQN
jgi:type II secretory pathway component PulC